jgi:hypothetical protein
VLVAVGSPGFATVEWGVIAVDQALHLSIWSIWPCAGGAHCLTPAPADHADMSPWSLSRWM